MSSISSSLSPLATTSPVVTESSKQLVWQTVTYLVCVLVVIAIICGTVLLIWENHWATTIIRHLKRNQCNQHPRSSNGCSATSAQRSSPPATTSDELQRPRDLDPLSRSPGTGAPRNPC